MHTAKVEVLTMRTENLIHPGEILREEFMKPKDITVNQLAADLQMPEERLDEIIHERYDINADTAHLLGTCFGTGSAFWRNLQINYDNALKEGDQLS